MEKQFEKLKEISSIQSTKGNWDYSQYMRGLANGLILAVAIMEDKEPVYKEDIKKYSTDKDEEKSFKEKITNWMHKAWN